MVTVGGGTITEELEDRLLLVPVVVVVVVAVVVAVALAVVFNTGAMGMAADEPLLALLVLLVLLPDAGGGGTDKVGAGGLTLEARFLEELLLL